MRASAMQAVTEMMPAVLASIGQQTPRQAGLDAPNPRTSATNPDWKAATRSLTGPGRVPISSAALARRETPGEVQRRRWSEKASHTC